MTQKKSPRVSIRKETLRHLTGADLDNVAGGVGGGDELDMIRVTNTCCWTASCTTKKGPMASDENATQASYNNDSNPQGGEDPSGSNNDYGSDPSASGNEQGDPGGYQGGNEDPGGYQGGNEDPGGYQDPGGGNEDPGGSYQDPGGGEES